MDITNQYYQDNAQEFFDSTVNVDVSQLYDHFLKYIPVGGKILDLGCGSGRDTKAFLTMGYEVDAIDGCSELCKLASEYTGIEVRCMDFSELNEYEKYDGIWACASLLHLRFNDISILLSKIQDALVESGVLYVSFKYGIFEGDRNGRYFTDMTLERFGDLLLRLDGLRILEKWYSEDVRTDKENNWINIILRKD